MGLDEETRRCLLELAYDVLPEDEAIGLRERIKTDPELAKAYGKAQQTAALLQEAARLQTAPIELKPPDSATVGLETFPRSPRKRGPHAQTRARGSSKRHAPPPWNRVATWITWAAAASLLLCSLTSYWYHRGQLADISAEHLRLTVTGPARVRPGVASQYAVITSAVTGDPVSAQIEFTLSSPDGQQLLMGHKEQTDEDGFLLVTIPAEAPIPPGAELKIVATYNDKVEQIATQLVVEPLGELAQLTTDKPVYQPGETIRYRAVILSQLGLTPNLPHPVHFEILDSQGAVVAASPIDVEPRQAVASGTFQLPPQATPGVYILVARANDGTWPEQRLPFTVCQKQDTPSLAASKPAGENTANLDGVNVSFFAEGGNLVAGLENRVYFLARDASGKPLHLTGHVLDDQDQEVAAVETTYAGMGAFNLEPWGGETYRLRIATPAGIKAEPKLPEAVSRPRLVLTTGSSVFAPGEPLEFNVRSTKDDLPLVAAAYCRGVLVGHQMFVPAKGANEVVVELDEAASGVIRLCIYDYSESPPHVVAERLVYRWPDRQLFVRVEKPSQPYRPGQNVELTLAVTDEAGQPVPAILGVGVVDPVQAPSAPQPTGQMLTHFLLTSALTRGTNQEDTDFYLCEDQKAHLALDLLLGTQGRPPLPNRKLGEERKAGPAVKHSNLFTDNEPMPPVVFDNLLDLRKRYRESLQAYRTNRTETLSLFTTLSFFGGAGLVLLATMLTLMNVAVGLWLWIPVVFAAGVSLSVGAILINPATLDLDADRAVAFVPFVPEPNLQARKTAVTPSTAPTPKPSDTSAYKYQNASAASNPAKDCAGTLYWNPFLQADAHGRATIQFDLPSSIRSFQLRVDAQGADRIGSLETQIDISK